MFDKRTELTGVGDQAFIPGAAPYALYARKGEKLAAVASGLDPATGEAMLTAAQLQQLVKIVLSRL